MLKKFNVYPIYELTEKQCNLSLYLIIFFYFSLCFNQQVIIE